GRRAARLGRRSARGPRGPSRLDRSHCGITVMGITRVAPPPGGGENCALATRERIQPITVGDRVPLPEALADRTSPFGPIFAVIRTEPFIVGSSRPRPRL